MKWKIKLELVKRQKNFIYASVRFSQLTEQLWGFTTTWYTEERK